MSLTRKDIKVIIFDFDGIILESNNVKTVAFAKLFANFPQYQEQIVQYHLDHQGISRFEKIPYIYREILHQPLSDETFKQLCQGYSNLVFEEVLKCEFVAGAYDFLEEYYQEIDFFVASGTPREEIRKIIRIRNLTQYFKDVFGSPESKQYWTQEILKQYTVSKDQVLFVGDALSDYEAARIHGIGFVGRITKENEYLFKELDIPIKIKDMLDLDALLEKRIAVER